MDSTVLQKILYQSLKDFFSFEQEEIKNEVNERAWCTRLAIYMTKWASEYKINGYYVDTDYNKKQNGEVKTIIGDEWEVIKIYADLILHSRGKKRPDNLIAIEVKKTYRKGSEKISDQKRLIAMTKESYNGVWSSGDGTDPEHVCGYLIGCYLEIDTNKMNYLIKIYQKGNEVNTYQGNIVTFQLNN